MGTDDVIKNCRAHQQTVQEGTASSRKTRPALHNTEGWKEERGTPEAYQVAVVFEYIQRFDFCVDKHVRFWLPCPLDCERTISILEVVSA